MKKYFTNLYRFLLVMILLFGIAGCKNHFMSNEEKSNALITNGSVVIFPEPQGLIEVKIDTLGKELPTSKDEGDLPVILTFTVGGTVLHTHGEIKVQGTSTERWPKKNWTLKFYSDEEQSERLQLKIGDSVASDKWIAKADWVDPTMLRNALSYRLWESMVISRKDFPQYEVDHAWLGKDNMNEGTPTGAQGFPKSHPINIKVNDEFYGISMLLLGHEPKNFNIDYNNPKHIYMEFDARGGDTSISPWDKFSSKGIGQWIGVYSPENEDLNQEQYEAIDRLGTLINGSQMNFEENFDKYLDKTNMLDMLLFLEVIYDYDAVSQDLEMVTYNSEKWYMLPWDKDTTFGMDWNEGGIKGSSETTLLINYESEATNQKPWYKTYHAFTPEVEARYAQLRDEEVFSVNNLYKMIEDITNKIPQEMWEEERIRWEDDDRPSLDETSASQIIYWFERRLVMLDEHFNYIE